MQDVIEKKTNVFEDRVILVTAAASFAVALSLFFLSSMQGTSTLVATFLGLGLSAMVYRFLGGIGETSFHLKAWKVAGTGAFLIGTIWFIDYSMSKNIVVNPSPNNSSWFAINAQGLPIEVEITGAENIEKPSDVIFENLNLQLKKTKGGYKAVAGQDGNGFSHGKIANAELAQAGLFANAKLVLDNKAFVVTEDPLRPYYTDYDLDPLPLVLSTGAYGGGFSRYTLKHKITGTYFMQGSISQRGAELVQLGGDIFLVEVVQVNHLAKKDEDKYAKFAVAKLRIATSVD